MAPGLVLPLASWLMSVAQPGPLQAPMGVGRSTVWREETQGHLRSPPPACGRMGQARGQVPWQMGAEG